MYIYLKGIELTDKVSKNLKEAKKRFFRLYEPFSNQPLSTDDYHNVHPSCSYETDGKLLLLEAINDLRERLIMWGGGYFGSWQQ